MSRASAWTTREGAPRPLGATWVAAECAYNFALYSKHAERVTLLLFRPDDPTRPHLTRALDPRRHKSGRVWHCRIPEDAVRPARYYAYAVGGPPPAGRLAWHAFDEAKLLLDPYAEAVHFPPAFDRAAASAPGSNLGRAALGVLPSPGAFAWADYTGCRNTLNASNQLVRSMIVDSMRHWTDAMHVDGFRFDLASVFARGADGTIGPDEAPLFGAISGDPDFARRRLIAEPWDPAGAMELGRAFPGVMCQQWNATPMLRAGDEFLQTQGGADNPWDRDDETTWLDWRRLDAHRDVFRFARLMIAFRKAHASIARSRFWRDDVHWYGVGRWPDLAPHSHALAYCLLGASEGDDDLYVMINAWREPLAFEIQEGEPPEWRRVVDTARPSPDDVCEPGREVPVTSRTCVVQSRSVVVLVRRRAT